MAYSIITPNSELEAVNEILSAVGAPPTNSLDDENNLDIINAKAVLNRVSREVQSRGWDFNIRENVTLPSDVFSQKVAYSSNYLRVIGSEYKLINQDGYFFDKDNRTFKFPNGITLSKLIVEESFSNLPTIIRKYITCRSARIFQSRYFGSLELDAELQNAEAEAKADLLDYELEYGGYNIFSSDSYISDAISR